MKCVLVIVLMSVTNAKTSERVRFPPFRLTPRTTINRRYYFITKTTVRIKRQNQACVMIYMLKDTSLTHCGAHFHWEGGMTGYKKRPLFVGSVAAARRLFSSIVIGAVKNNFRPRMRTTIFLTISGYGETGKRCGLKHRWSITLRVRIPLPA